jgi:hypothetical protein
VLGTGGPAGDELLHDDDVVEELGAPAHGAGGMDPGDLGLQTRGVVRPQRHRRRPARLRSGPGRVSCASGRDAPQRDDDDESPARFDDSPAGGFGLEQVRLVIHCSIVSTQL